MSAAPHRPAGDPNSPRDRRNPVSKLGLWLGGVLLAMLLAAAFTLGSLNVPFAPDRRVEFVVLFAVSTFIFAALIVFGLVLTRSLLRLWAERRAEAMGSRFKTKMVMGAMGISLLPIVVMFFISYALMNRTLSKWFPRPLEIASEESNKLLADLGKAELERLTNIARTAVTPESGLTGVTAPASDSDYILRALSVGADVAWVLNSNGKPKTNGANAPPRPVRTLPSGVEVWERAGGTYLVGRAAFPGGTLVAGRRAPADFLKRYAEVESQLRTYRQQSSDLRTYKNQMLAVLVLVTLALLFSATWFALFLSKMVTVPIQALAEATQQVSRGNLGHQVDVLAHDELGILVGSFNKMTAQLAESRDQIDDFTRSLQQAVTELEQRRQLMEAILENIPTGVLSLDSDGVITKTNQPITRTFGERPGEPGMIGRFIGDVVGPDAARGVQQLMRKSLRMGAATSELELQLDDPRGPAGAGRVLHAAVTVSSLGPRSSNPGFVVVIDDLTDLLRAQKAAAWQEVAQRIAHEIKNPLTPIQLSAQRLAKHLERQTSASVKPADGEVNKLISECASMIEREVATLKSLVDEFSQFARFPTPKPVPMELNSVVRGALGVFAGRLENIRVHTALAPDLPPLKADPEMLRRVLVNLIDNAAEAMEGASLREMTVSTRLVADGETIEVVVADSGHGISPEDKNKLFLPHFSTRGRGTGLGLAIAGRIVSEHHGTIRVEDNHPAGARFLIRLPVMLETQAQAQQAETRIH